MSRPSSQFRDQQDRPDDGSASAGSRLPSAELVDADGETVLRVDLPGVDASGIDLRWDEDAGLLTVTGDPGDGGVPFFREFRFPATFSPEAVSASFENGVLEVTLPVDVDAPGRSIEVRGDTESRIDRIRREIDDLETELAEQIDGVTAGEMVADLRDRVDELAESVRR